MRRLPSDAKAHIELACVWACKFGRTAVVDFLLETGVDPAAKDTDSMTLIHWAAANGCMDLIKLLLERGVPLELENRWGGTVLNSTLHFALYQPVPGVNYPAVVEMLLAAGADVRVVTYPTGNKGLGEVLQRFGARAS
jgi:hypothetical protein